MDGEMYEEEIVEEGSQGTIVRETLPSVLMCLTSIFLLIAIIIIAVELKTIYELF